jgi:hypothetical protein
VFKVEEFPACPSNWMHGSSMASSYFFAVDAGKHLWLDFNMNAHHNNDVAIVMSIQGMNPITGQESKVLRLEQYKNNCPLHDLPFGQDRFCTECNFKWPAQNYMTTTSHPRGKFWIDGWRIEEGKIRGFLITAETMKGIAAQIIGEDRVWAIGIAFYLSKDPKPQPKRVTRSAMPAADYGNLETYGTKSLSATRSMGPMRGGGGGVTYRGGGGDDSSFSFCGEESALEMAGEEVDTEQLEIGAGAKITQELAYPDTKKLDHYEDKPVGVLYGNYCTTDDFTAILQGGRRDMTAGGEGALAGLDVGN